MNDECQLIYSTPQQTYARGDKAIDIRTFPQPVTGWPIGVVGQPGNSLR